MLLEQLPLSIFFLTLFTFSFSIHFWVSASEESPTIYEVLKSNGLPMGLFPKGVTNFSLDDSGRFQVYLDQACNAKFEDELHYDRNVAGNLTYGQIDGLSGISAKDLFLWFSVKEIWVDIPSSGLIYFDVGVVSKQFSLSSFESPRDCLASPVPKVTELQSFLMFDFFNVLILVTLTLYFWVFAFEFIKLDTILNVSHQLEFNCAKFGQFEMESHQGQVKDWIVVVPKC